MATQHALTTAGSIAILSAFTLSLSACEAPSALEAQGYQLAGNPNLSIPTATSKAIREIHPGLAVRGMACLACHANIQASVITDFGYGDAWYLDQDLHASPNQLFGSAHYNPYTWQTLERVAGQVVIPQSIVPGSIVSATLTGETQSMNLDSFLNSSNAQNLGVFWNSSYWGSSPVSNQLAFTQAFSPPVDPLAFTSPLPTLNEQSVYIAAPTSSQILALAPHPAQAGAWIQNASGAAAPDGLAITTGVNQTPYITP